MATAIISLGPGTVLERFPGARFVARPEVIQIMRQQASPESLETFWNPRFPDQISSQLAIAEELTGNVINLEGHDLVSVPLGFTDTASTTCLHVPSIGLIVAGDAAYNGDHLHLSESPDQQKRQEWIAALDKMESLKPRAVIAGHKRVGNDDSPRIIEETGNISAISSALPCGRRPRGNYMTKCSSCTLIGSTEVRSGLQCAP
jgi:glyoxylase-like metal-dependent hydrolase (beta-lactamase superfamily II)